DLETIINKVIEKNYLIFKTNFKVKYDYFYEGKVRDNYVIDRKRIIVVTDRLSAFDRVITAIPFKGQILNQITAFWFEATKNIVPNHVLTVPDPNVMVVKECKPLPVEMVIRKYITGSAWRSYEKDPRKPISGIIFPQGLRKNQELDEPIITPSTKAEKGVHDEYISRQSILEKKIVSREIYEQMEEYCFKLFEKGQEIAKKNGLILVDTKYEFGLDDEGKLIVIDEIHTPDSSRFWILENYHERFEHGLEPEILDKEFIRDWLRIEKGFMGDGPIPEIDLPVKIDLCKRYIRNYEMITGSKFNYQNFDENVSPITRIENNLKKIGII
ncbi:MAG: phosphoribosylaminoimidazolesuccinocarboxamide synthase, partial [Promethearchaeota archaeon]